MLRVACATPEVVVGYFTSKGLRELRQYIGLTQAQLATLLGVNRVTLARWEAGAAAAPTAGPWLSALETAHRMLTRHEDKPAGALAFLANVTPDTVDVAWAHVLALAYPDAGRQDDDDGTHVVLLSPGPQEALTTLQGAWRCTPSEAVAVALLEALDRLNDDNCDDCDKG
jgi:transcriptional regulator with XRE-family HTH domain